MASEKTAIELSLQFFSSERIISRRMARSVSIFARRLKHRQNPFRDLCSGLYQNQPLVYFIYQIRPQRGVVTGRAGRSNLFRRVYVGFL